MVRRRSFLHRDDITLGGQGRGDVLDVIRALPLHPTDVVIEDQGGQDQTHLHHGKVFTDAVSSSRREGIEGKILDGREGGFFRDPTLWDKLLGLGKVFVGMVQCGQLGDQDWKYAGEDWERRPVKGQRLAKNFKKKNKNVKKKK